MSTEEIDVSSAPSTVSFDESKFKIRSRSFMVVGQPEIPSIIRILVKSGVAKSEKQAVTVIVVTVAIILIASGLLINKSISVDSAKVTPGLLSL